MRLLGTCREISWFYFHSMPVEQLVVKPHFTDKETKIQKDEQFAPSHTTGKY